MEKTIFDYNAAITIDGSTHWLLIQPGNNSVDYNRINRNVFLGVTGQPADISTAQNLTNKTLDNTNILTIRDDRFTLQDNIDTTKQAQFQLSGITTATTRTYTLPNASSTLADISTAQTFTNKTLTAPSITGGTITNTTVSVDAIGEFTPANGVTIDGLNIKDGKLNTNNSVVNANVTDSAITPAKLLAGTGTGWTWQTWVPTWTNFTIGNAVVNARYIQIGKTVFFSIELTYGSSSAMGTAPTFTLPVTSVTGYRQNVTVLGNMGILDVGSAIFWGYALWNTTTTAALGVSNAGTAYSSFTALTSAIPMTWATSDGISILGSYEAA